MPFFLLITGIKIDYLALPINEKVAILGEHWTMNGLYICLRRTFSFFEDVQMLYVSPIIVSWFRVD